MEWKAYSKVVSCWESRKCLIELPNVEFSDGNFLIYKWKTIYAYAESIYQKKLASRVVIIKSDSFYLINLYFRVAY